ncbi:metalloregulator ArsR/SmtB family transcription factor [Macrococcoides bohemicum]|uniref:ArsR/SmtB family transcription factor n=1 Tax=Macrococcoides bohemicum TaxID=1903056 RepID=UPI001C5E6189|nr:metalloregulator ArsR/SmtB family transcription factor [Macrococcus bohemicus]QYA45157.1 metalloregulator ArsR/SmtB family transcription factor [Macrococcus bohemicus]
MDYEYLAKLLKVLSDKNRLEIVDLLSCGPLCACDILEHFEFSQPTLSHHMKQLKQSGIVTSWKEGTNVMYANNLEVIEQIVTLQNKIFVPHQNCVCKTNEEC